MSTLPDRTTNPESDVRSPVARLLHAARAWVRGQWRASSPSVHAPPPLVERDARFQAIFDQSPAGILLVGDDGTILEANPAFQRLLGYSCDELLALTTDDLSLDGDVAATGELTRALHAGSRDGATFETRYVRKSGEPLWASVAVARADADGRPGLLAIVQDITERKRLEAEPAPQALHDPLTGLANRALFRDRVEHALQRSARDGGGTLGVLVLDLDGFEAVNDSLGHDAGDELLAAVATRLRESTRDSDTVARLGGNEFAVLIENVRTDDQALVVAERILGSLRAPATVQGRAVRARASIGVARARAGDATDELLRNADVALYHAKQAGTERITFFVPEMPTAVLDRLELEGDLRAAVEWQGDDEGELHVVYQPIVDLTSGDVTGYEALARWAHPTRGAVPPSAFISVAEDTGLIAPLGRWVLRTACREAARWAGSPGVSVNLSASQLREPELVADVRAALDDARLAPARLTLEVTETAIMRDVDRTLATLQALKALGIRLAVDDAGTGYSSLGHLQRFPVDVLKVDKAFVDGVACGSGEAALARTVIALGMTLGLRTVAEGIESAEQEAALRLLGCEQGQGYLFARPMSPEHIPHLTTIG